MRRNFRLVVCSTIAVLAVQAGPALARPREQASDLVVLSDLHAGEGELRKGRGFSPMEDFRAEPQLVALLDHLRERQARAGTADRGGRSGVGRRLELVIAGDAFEFLNVVHPPAGKSWPVARAKALGSTEGIAKLTAQRIVQGHPALFSALGRLVRDGHQVTFLAGNHDLETHFPSVQAIFKRAIVGPKAGAAAARRVSFERSWLLARDRVLIEHGNRYDPLNGLEHPEEPFEPGKNKVRTPAGSLLVYRFYQPLKEKVPSLTKNNLRLPVLLSIVTHLPTLLRAAFDSARGLIEMARERGRQDSWLRREEPGALRELATQLRPVINANRAAHGRPPESATAVRAELRQFEGLAGAPYPSAVAERAGLLRVAASMVRPSQLRQIDRGRSDYGAGLARGRGFALGRLDFDVHICGHSHVPTHQVTTVASRQLHVIDTGTWSRRSDANRDGPRQLTFAEVIHDQGGQLHVKLRRWDADRHRAVLVRAEPVSAR